MASALFRGAVAPQFGVDEALGVLSSLSLTSVTVQDYLVVLSSDFDIIISDEPYMVRTLFYNVKAGIFFARLWCKTVNIGNVLSVEQFYEVCNKHFKRRERICLGSLYKGEVYVEKPFLISQTPFPRKIAKTCTGFISENSSANSISCKACDKLSECKIVNPLCKAASPLYSAAITSEVMNPLDLVHVTIKEELQGSLVRATPLLNVPDVEELLRNDHLNVPSVEELLRNDHLNVPDVEELLRNDHLKKPDVEELLRNDHLKEPDVKELLVLPPQQFSKQNHHSVHAEEGGITNSDLSHKQIVHDSRRTIKSAYISDEELLRNDHLKEPEVEELLKNDHPNESDVLQEPQQRSDDLKASVVLQRKATELQEQLKRTNDDDFAVTDLPQESDFDSPDMIMMADEGEQRDPLIYNSKLRCQFCGLQFVSATGLRSHKQTKHLWGPFMCRTCKCRLPFARELLQHMIKSGHDKDSQAVRCPYCQKLYNMRGIGLHFEQCVRDSYRYQCSQCGEKFRQRNQRDHHEVKRHPANRRPNNNVAETKGEPPAQIGRKCWRCPLCPEVFNNTTMLSHHRVRKHNWGHFKCFVCGEKYNFVADLIEHVNNVDNAEHYENGVAECPSCKDQLPITDLEKHYADCNVAKRKESRKLSAQKVSENERERKVECPFCDKNFNSRTAYYLHRRKKHLWANFDCPECDKELHFVGDLVEHMRSAGHDRTGAATCPSCREEIGTADFERHVGFCIPSEAKRRYRKEILGKIQCEECGLLCTRKRLKYHVMTHREPKFACSYCGKMMKTRSTLTAHERMHTGEKPYE